MLSEISQSEKQEIVERCLNGLIPEWNLRLFCDAKVGPDGFPERILWVEKITIQHEEEGDLVYAPKEKYWLKGKTLRNRLEKDRRKPIFSEQRTYIAEKIKNFFKTLWKKKGR